MPQFPHSGPLRPSRHRLEGSFSHRFHQSSVEWQRVETFDGDIPQASASFCERPSQSSRRDNRKSDLRTEREQWGQESELHLRRLDTAHVNNILKQHQRYTRRNASAKEIRNSFSLSFNELCRNEQIRQGMVGPVLIYRPSSVLLFLRGCADHRICRVLSVETLLGYQNKSLDYCYHLAELCIHFPSYQGKAEPSALYARTLNLSIVDYLIGILSRS